MLMAPTDDDDGDDDRQKRRVRSKLRRTHTPFRTSFIHKSNAHTINWYDLSIYTFISIHIDILCNNPCLVPTQYIPIIMTLYHAAAIMKNFYDRTSIAHFMFNRYHRDHQVHQNGPVYNFIAFPDYLHTNKLLLVRGSVPRPNAYTRRASAR